MVRYFRALDPRRSLATAVAWLAVLLSLVNALALVAVGDYAARGMLSQRDAGMQRFAADFAQELEAVLAGAPAGDAAQLAAESLAAAAERARERARPDPRAHVVVMDAKGEIVYAGAPFPQPPPGALPGVLIVPDEDGERTVVVAAPADAAPSLQARGLRVAAVQRAHDLSRIGDGGLQDKLTAISILLSITAALAGAAFARRLTRRLGKLTEQVRRVARQEAEGIVEPRGRDEVAVLGRAFSRLLQALRHEREDLARLTRELEERVQARTREVERLAAESRYAAVVRERLRLARDLHDTLAHSMMEMLLEIRTLRTLHARDPARLAAELERAEELAHQGLQEARAAITHIRLNTVRDLGLGAALATALGRLAERTGLDVHYEADPQAASFADPRAETLFRIAEEALRNIDKHAQARRVDVRLAAWGDDTIELTITDDGVGFDPAAERPGHYGVLGIREQAELIGAELDLRSAHHAGATVRMRLRVGPEMRTASAAVEAAATD